MFIFNLLVLLLSLMVNDARTFTSTLIRDNQINFNCTDSYRLKMDRLVNTIMAFGENGRTFPENDQQLKPFCE